MRAWFIFLGAGILAQHAAGATYPPRVSLEEVRAHVDAAPTGHPRLLATADQLDALRDGDQTDSLKGNLAGAVVAQAEAYLGVPPVERILEGRRLLGESRRCVKRVLYLAMAYQVTGDTRYAARCEQEMLAVSRFSDWNPSHFLDVGEMAFALAVGYDWLYDTLPSSSRDAIRTALIEKAIELPFTTKHRGWVNAQNNWGQVCHAGLTAAALAILEDEPGLTARTAHQAAHHVTRSMAAFAPNGSYPEGPGYWSYGTTYNVLLIAALESVLGTDYGLSNAPGFSQTGEYVNLVAGPSGLFFNYADGGSGRAPQVALHWLAKRYQRPDWILDEPLLLTAEIKRLQRKNPRDSRSRFLPLTLLWMAEPDPATPNRMPLHWSSGGDVPITLHRGSWGDPNTTFVGLKGGSPSANHGQMDTGSFVLDALGIRWATDLGAEGYHRIESRGMNLWNRNQDSDRWTIFRQNSQGHNTLVINNQAQQVAGNGRFMRFSNNPAHPFSVLDLSEVYDGQATSVRRGLAMLPSGDVLVQDELHGLAPGSPVRWGMITPAEAGEPGETTMVLSKDGKRLTLRLLSPAAARWQVIDTATPRNEWDSPNPGTRMVAFEVVAPADGSLTLAVQASPLPNERDLTERLAPLHPLDEW